MPRGGVQKWAPPLVVAALTFIAFLPALQAGFVTWDDDTNFLRNQSYRGLGLANLRWMWTTFHLGHYVPLSWMTLGVDYVIWGMNPFGYHLTNVLLHCANAALLYVLGLRLFELTQGAKQDAGAVQLGMACGALFFAIHPLRVESVAWITERRDVLSLFFLFTAVIAYLNSVTRLPGWRRWYLGSLGLFVAALLSKGTSVTLPAILLILNAYPLRRLTLRRDDIRRVAIEVLPFGMLSAAVSLLTIIALGANPEAQLPLMGKVAVSAYGFMFYLGKTIVPLDLAPLYPLVLPIDPLAAKYIASYLGIAALAAMLWRVRRSHPAIVVGALAFTVMVLPLLGIVQNGAQYAADRYTYHASPALSLLVGAAIALAPIRLRGPVRLISVLALLVLAGATWIQTRFWHDSEALWRRVLSLNESSIARTAYGNVLTKAGRLAEAIPHYRRSLEIDPRSTEAMNNLGVAAAREGRFDEAIALYEQAINVQAKYYEAHNNWGIVLSQQGRFDAAIEKFRRALEIEPGYADAEVNWGNALVRSERAAEAIAHYQTAIRLAPDLVEAHLNLGVAFAQTGNTPGAVEKFRRVLELEPGHSSAAEYLARLGR